MKKGFTLVELLVTITIISVMAAVAIPSFVKTREKNNARQAVSYAQAIRLAEKMRYAKTGNYLAASGNATIRTNLGVEVATSAYNFNVTVNNAANPKTFSVIANKGAVAADCTGSDTICVDQDGAWSGGATCYLPTY